MRHHSRTRQHVASTPLNADRASTCGNRGGRRAVSLTCSATTIAQHCSPWSLGYAACLGAHCRSNSRLLSGEVDCDDGGKQRPTRHGDGEGDRRPALCQGTMCIAARLATQEHVRTLHRRRAASWRLLRSHASTTRRVPAPEMSAQGERARGAGVAFDEGTVR